MILTSALVKTVLAEK